MDLAAIEQKLEAGEDLKIKYRYPVEGDGGMLADHYRVRSDKLVDVSTERERFFTRFRGELPIWVELDEVIEITDDDGSYQEFPDEGSDAR